MSTIRVYTPPNTGAIRPLAPYEQRAVMLFDPVPSDWAGMDWGEAMSPAPSMSDHQQGGAGGTKGPTTLETVGQYLPIVGDLLASYSIKGDARVQVGIYEAKIQNLKAMRSQFPILAFYYDNEIRKAEGALKALKSTLAVEAQDSADAVSRAQTLATVGAGVGIIGGVALTALIVVAAVRLAKKK